MLGTNNTNIEYLNDCNPSLAVTNDLSQEELEAREQFKFLNDYWGSEF